jgi:hypothetical protein
MIGVTVDAHGRRYQVVGVPRGFEDQAEQRMGWSARRDRRGASRFDSWQNRPDRSGSRPWQPRRADIRAVLIWLGVFAVLILGYGFGDALWNVSWHTLARLMAGQES